MRLGLGAAGHAHDPRRRLVVHRRIDEPRADRVDGQARPGEFECKAASEADRAMLGRAVRGGTRNALQAGDRGDDDQPLVIPFDEIGQGQLCSVEQGRQVGGDDPVPGLTRGLSERRAVAHAGIEDDEIERAVGFARGGEGGFHRRAVGEVAGEGFSAGLSSDRLDRFGSSPDE